MKTTVPYLTFVFILLTFTGCGQKQNSGSYHEPLASSPEVTNDISVMPSLPPATSKPELPQWLSSLSKATKLMNGSKQQIVDALGDPASTSSDTSLWGDKKWEYYHYKVDANVTQPSGPSTAATRQINLTFDGSINSTKLVSLVLEGDFDLSDNSLQKDVETADVVWNAIGGSAAGPDSVLYRKEGTYAPDALYY